MSGFFSWVWKVSFGFGLMGDGVGLVMVDWIWMRLIFLYESSGFGGQLSLGCLSRRME